MREETKEIIQLQNKLSEELEGTIHQIESIQVSLRDTTMLAQALVKKRDYIRDKLKQLYTGSKLDEDWSLG